MEKNVKWVGQLPLTQWTINSLSTIHMNNGE